MEERMSDTVSPCRISVKYCPKPDVGTALEAGVAPCQKEDGKAYRVLFGEGVAPWKEIIAAAESVGGVEYYLMEQEGSRFSEFETSEKCLATYKAMRAGA